MSILFNDFHHGLLGACLPEPVGRRNLPGIAVRNESNQDVCVNGAHVAPARVAACPASSHRASDASEVALKRVLDGCPSIHTESTAEPQLCCPLRLTPGLNEEGGERPGMMVAESPHFSPSAGGPAPRPRFCSIFSQLLQLFPRTRCQRLVTATQAERHARGFTCWGEVLTMVCCQLGRAHSLREICGGLARREGKLAIWAPRRRRAPRWPTRMRTAGGNRTNGSFPSSWRAVRRSPGPRSFASRTSS